MADIVDLSPDDIAVAGALLARAFVEDGLAKHMYPDQQDRENKTPWHFSAFVRYGVLFGRVSRTAGALRGVAVWFPPGQHQLTDKRVAAAGLDAAPAMLGEEAFGRFISATQQIEPFHEQDVPEPHWYLALIGVDPDCAGQGIGGELMQPVLVEADRDALPCYLETANGRNVPFYERHGFEVLRHGTIPGTEARYWTMLRKPR